MPPPGFEPGSQLFNLRRICCIADWTLYKITLFYYVCCHYTTGAIIIIFNNSFFNRKRPRKGSNLQPFV